MMQALDKDLRGALEKTVKAARTVAETAAHAAVDQLGVGHDKPEAFLSDAEKSLRNRLRTHGKQLGDTRDSKSTNPTYGKQDVQHLVQEVAYQHWHRMLFARFLADNNLLMYDGVAVTVEECDELAPEEGSKSGWELAGKLAARMLPQVFKPGSPVFELTFAPEHQSELERLLIALPEPVFTASDSLGWVYQFWQADYKERINDSEVRISATELPAVTQLFTEPYMVAFLLHNAFGAWWATRNPGKQCPINLRYFRTLEGGMPAAGKFDGWPASLAQFKLLDPCCGSGHFLVAAFLMLVPMRMAAESLSPKEAVNRVLAENIHGLEIDPRCVEIAVFAVALEAWRYPDTTGKPLGVREIPAPNIACCGLEVAAKAQDWEALVPDEAPNAEYLRQELRHLHASFTKAPLLGSLLDPARSLGNDLASSSFDQLHQLLERALATERPATSRGQASEMQDSVWDLAITARGLLDAALLLQSRYHLVVTNVPYLARGKQCEALKDFCDNHYPRSKTDLATVFLQRCLELCDAEGTLAVVSPQNWWFLGGYKEFRKELLAEQSVELLVALGEEAWQHFGDRGPLASLTIISKRAPAPSQTASGIDALSPKTIEEKIAALVSKSPPMRLLQSGLRSNPDGRIAFVEISTGLLSRYADSFKGMSTGDLNRFVREYWEMSRITAGWVRFQGTAEASCFFGGRSQILYWQDGSGDMVQQPTCYVKGRKAWGHKGVFVSQMRSLAATLYSGEHFDENGAAITPYSQEDLPAVFAFVGSAEYRAAVKSIDSAVKVTNKTLVKVAFDLAHWQQVAAEQYPNGLPKPYSNDPTQWLFHGHPETATDPLQVAVARMLGYRWPTETDGSIELADEARSSLERCNELAVHADGDGIVCIPPVGRESSANDRLLNLLATAYGSAWSNDTLARLLAAVDHKGKSLETWLRDKFFTQHCALFANRPFVWHVWDGLRDGFAALVNYHKLNYKTLESLTYTYLGDWMGRQKRDADNGVDGAQERLAAAETLKKRLELILAGESPNDIFVRWKPIEEQPIGWNPDLNDGVRLNIRPFLSVPDVGRRGAGVLRDRPKSLHWEKDRGSDVPSAPWYELGLQYDGKVGDRINDHHLMLADKRDARAKLGKT